MVALSASSFNEAAAFCGGKLGRRPKHTTAESGFNEAAAFCGGKFVVAPADTARQRCFNEAAAFCGGKFDIDKLVLKSELASMRPPRSAAENRRGRGPSRRRPHPLQ